MTASSVSDVSVDSVMVAVPRIPSTWLGVGRANLENRDWVLARSNFSYPSHGRAPANNRTHNRKSLWWPSRSMVRVAGAE